VAQLHHAVQEELTVSLQDFLLRRTGIGTSRCQGRRLRGGHRAIAWRTHHRLERAPHRRPRWRRTRHTWRARSASGREADAATRALALVAGALRAERRLAGAANEVKHDPVAAGRDAVVPPRASAGTPGSPR
jgi:hypothetical protein